MKFFQLKMVDIFPIRFEVNFPSSLLQTEVAAAAQHLKPYFSETEITALSIDSKYGFSVIGQQVLSQKAYWTLHTLLPLAVGWFLDNPYTWVATGGYALVQMVDGVMNYVKQTCLFDPNKMNLRVQSNAENLRYDLIYYAFVALQTQMGKQVHLFLSKAIEIYARYLDQVDLSLSEQLQPFYDLGREYVFSSQKNEYQGPFSALKSDINGIELETASNRDDLGAFLAGVFTKLYEMDREAEVLEMIHALKAKKSFNDSFPSLPSF